MPFRAMRDRAQGRTCLPWVISLKYWRKVKCLIKRDTISLEIFRKEKKNSYRWQFFNYHYWAFLTRHFELQVAMMWADSVRNSDLGAWLIQTDSASPTGTPFFIVSPNPYQSRHHFCLAEKRSGSRKVPRLKWQGRDSNPGLPTTDPDLTSLRHSDPLASTLA